LNTIPKVYWRFVIEKAGAIHFLDTRRSSFFVKLLEKKK
jgi:hypothetical protein